MKMWSGRFSQALDPEFEQWQRSFPYDKRLLPQEIAASKAHAQALRNAQVLSADELAAILGGLDQILREGIPTVDDPAIEDVHHFVEKRLTDIIGETGRKLHTGRSRNEQIATDLRLYVRDHIDSIRSLIAELIAELLMRADEAGTAAMPSYTHMQRAEPVLAAHWLLAYVEMLFRDMDRFADCRERLNECPLGSAAIAGTFLPLDRKAIATVLGFARPTANSMDATSDRDFAIEFAQASSLLAMHLSRWADEMILFSTQEYGFLQLPEQYATGSSAMPQKKNPDALELIRGKCGRITGQTNALTITLKGLPLAYNKDLQESQQPVFEVAEQTMSMLRVAAGFMKTVGFKLDAMQRAASTGFMNAMSAAGFLSKKGIPFRDAHEKIGTAVRMCIEKNCEIENLSLDELKQCGIDFGEEFYTSLNLDAVLACHNVEGGTAPANVQQALAAAKQKLTKARMVSHARA